MRANTYKSKNHERFLKIATPLRAVMLFVLIENISIPINLLRQHPLLYTALTFGFSTAFFFAYSHFYTYVWNTWQGIDEAHDR